MSDLATYLEEKRQLIEGALEECLPGAEVEPTRLHEAMRYPVQAGGKRLRPILVLAAAEAFGMRDCQAALPAACAVELLHTYSLVHDDLPAMDDDDLRRGRPTTHVVYGEAMAVLVGDGLLTAAFQELAKTPSQGPWSTGHYVAELAHSSGSVGMIGGQVLDLAGEGKSLTREQLDAIHGAKTAALLAGCLRLGAMAAGAREEGVKAVGEFGRLLGLAFQVLDDILDETQSSETLGKTAGKDQASQKATYPALLGLEASQQEAGRLTEEALQVLRGLPEDTTRLEEIARRLLSRES